MRRAPQFGQRPAIYGAGMSDAELVAYLDRKQDELCERWPQWTNAECRKAAYLQLHVSLRQHIDQLVEEGNLLKVITS